MTDQEFCEAVSAARSTMRSAIWRIVPPEDVDDVVSDAVVRAWIYRHSFDGRASVKTWLAAIAKNAGFDYRRRIEILPKLSGIEVESFTETLADPDPSPESRRLRLEVLELVDEQIRLLTPAQREAFGDWLGDRGTRSQKATNHRAKLRVIDGVRLALGLQPVQS